METESTILAAAIQSIDTSPAQRERLTQLAAQASLPSWFENIDNSPYAITDWLWALAAFDAWMEEKEITARPVDSMLGYLECCTLSLAETLSLPDFADVTRENLDQYGFDAALPATKDAAEDGDA